MKTFLVASLSLMIAGEVCLAQSGAQSLGELARQNKHDKKATVVITDDDIRSSRGVISVVGDDSDRPAASAPSEKKTVEANQATPARDNSQVAELKKKLDSYKQEQAGWKSSAKKYEDELATESDDFRRTTYQEALDNDRKNVAAVQRKIDQTSADLSKAQQAAAAASAKGGPDNTPKAGFQP